MLDKNKCLKKQSQGKEVWIPAMLNKDGIMINYRKESKSLRFRLLKQTVKWFIHECVVDKGKFVLKKNFENYVIEKE